MNPVVSPSASAMMNRRNLLALGAAGLAGIALPGRSRDVAAEGLTGEITVQFNSRGGALETAVNQVIADLQAANPGAKITVADPLGGGYETQLILQLSSGKGPDVFLLTSLLMAELAQGQAVLPLDSFIGAWADWAQFGDFTKNHLPYKGSIWGLPYLLDTHFLYYRKDLFEQAGLPTEWNPTSLEDIVVAAQAVKAAAPDVIPYVLYAGANPGNSTAVRGFIPLLAAYGGTLKDEKGKWIIDSCAIRQTLRFIERVYQTDKIVPQSVMSSPGADKAMRTALAGGQAAILFDGCWVWDDWMRADPTLVDKIGYTLFPRADGGAPFTIGGFGNAWHVNARAKSPDLAWAFIAAMNSKAIQIALNLDDLHVPSRTDAANDPTFASTPFNQAMVASIASAVITELDPAMRQLVGVIQKATGNVATGSSKPDDAVKDYAADLKRILGDDNVVEQACQ